MPNYKRVHNAFTEGNPAPIINPHNAIIDCLWCGYAVSSADGLCDDCWRCRHDARFDEFGNVVETEVRA